MARATDWQSRIGRRVRLRDLHAFFAVVECGSMAKAGVKLGVTQPAVSKAIGELEAAVGVRLLDRSSRGVEATLYGHELLKCGRAAFEDLREGIRNIEHLADPDVGEVRIASNESIVAGFLPAVIERFSTRFPRVKLDLSFTSTHQEGFAALHERKADVVTSLPPNQALTEDVRTEVLFYDRLCLAAAAQSRWARRRKINFADLADAVFISPPPGAPGAIGLDEAFRMAGLPPPQVTLTTFSVHARNILPSLADRFVAVLPASVLCFNCGQYPLKELPLELPVSPLPIVIATLKDRTMRPSVERFIESAREVAKLLAEKKS